MDLYIQVGVLLLMLAALSLFIYIYTAPAQQFTQKINETNQKINDRLVTVEGLDVAPFMNSVNTPGTTIYPIIRDAEANKIAVLVQTKNQQGLVVNYGYQIRPANYTSVQMNPIGTAGVGNPNGTDFEKNFVTTAKEVFKTDQSQGVKRFGSNAMILGSMNRPTDTQFMQSRIYDGSDTFAPGSLIALADPISDVYTAPHLMFGDPTVTMKQAVQTGRTFSSTGFLYTDQVLKTDAPINNNFSYADNQGSLYRFDQNASYYTTLIIDANDDIIGIYVEEHGVNPGSAALAGMMYANGTLTQLY